MPSTVLHAIAASGFDIALPVAVALVIAALARLAKALQPWLVAREATRRELGVERERTRRESSVMIDTRGRGRVRSTGDHADPDVAARALRRARRSS